LGGLNAALDKSVSYPYTSGMVEFTVKFNGSGPLGSIEDWAGKKNPRVPISSQTSDAVSELLSRYPLQDVGLTLIHGPLPHGAVTYDVETIFENQDQQLLTLGNENGYGLIFKIEDKQAHVQYGNGVFTMDSAELVGEKYQCFVTGLQFCT
jgi:hypothetical protein